MIHGEGINYPLLGLLLPSSVRQPAQSWANCRQVCWAQWGQPRSGRSSLCGSGRMISFPLGFLLGETFWEKLRPSLKKASSEFWPTFNLVLVSPQMAFVEAPFTYLLSGEIKMVKPWHLLAPILFFLWQTHKDNCTRSSHRGERWEVQGIRTQV